MSKKNMDSALWELSKDVIDEDLLHRMMEYLLSQLSDSLSLDVSIMRRLVFPGQYASYKISVKFLRSPISIEMQGTVMLQLCEGEPCVYGKFLLFGNGKRIGPVEDGLISILSIEYKEVGGEYRWSELTWEPDGFGEWESYTTPEQS